MTAIPPFARQALAELVDYDPNNGVFIWKRRGNPAWDSKNAGRVAGSRHSGGYHAISIMKTKYLAHVLAWYLFYGEWPDQMIDHVNLNKKDNRICNLRLATPVENGCNASVRSDNVTGYRGVHFLNRRKCFYSKIQKDGKTYHIGYFKSAHDAGLAYARKARELYGDYCPEYLRDLVAS